MVEPHEHEFFEPDSEIIEDGAWIAIYNCSHAEVTGSQTSERHDETFYEYGAECEATKWIRLDVGLIEENTTAKQMGESEDEWVTVATGDSVLLENDIHAELMEAIETTIVSELGREPEPSTSYKHDGEKVTVVDGSEKERIIDVTLTPDDFYERPDLSGTYRVHYNQPEVTVDEW